MVVAVRPVVSKSEGTFCAGLGGSSSFSNEFLKTDEEKVSM